MRHWVKAWYSIPMSKSDTKSSTKSKRSKAYRKMLKESLARPGVREVMEVYGYWYKKDIDVWQKRNRRRARATSTS